MNTIELAKSVVIKPLQKGAEESDVFISIDDEFSAMIKDAEIESIKQAVTHGLGIRVFKNKKIGFSYTTDFSNFAIEKAIEEAITLAENLKLKKCPECGGELTEPRRFNLMFKTFMGPVENEAQSLSPCPYLPRRKR